MPRIEETIHTICDSKTVFSKMLSPFITKKPILEEPLKQKKTEFDKTTYRKLQHFEEMHNKNFMFYVSPFR